MLHFTQLLLPPYVEVQTSQMAELICLVWLGTAELVRRTLIVPTFGSELAYGSERWRSAFGLPMQLVVFPTLLWIAAESRRSDSTMLNAADLSFAYIFGVFMLLDFVILESIDTLIKLHHLLCFAGNAFALYGGAPVEAFALYFCGVVALEVGTGSLNLWCLYPRSTPLFYTYAITMTLSNIACTACVFEWYSCCLTVLSLFPRLMVVSVMVALLFLRQKAVYTEYLRPYH